MKNLTKKQLIEVFSKVLKEYEEDRHENRVLLCSKCILYSSILEYQYTVCVTNCVENIHSNKKGNKNYGCINRLTKAHGSCDLTSTKKRKIILYHQKVIDYLMNVKKFNTEVFKKKLLQFDREAYESK